MQRERESRGISNLLRNTEGRGGDVRDLKVVESVRILSEGEAHEQANVDEKNTEEAPQSHLSRLFSAITEDSNPKKKTTFFFFFSVILHNKSTKRKRRRRSRRRGNYSNAERPQERERVK